ncbi:MAG: SDR family oxidoreductase [Planctomycetes bacterium]|nr:SDR family oxidoreductase [Planctomycetota bacterium]
MNLAGRAAIITGANQGLGKAIAARFVRQGASVLLMARGEELLRQTEAELRPLCAGPGQKVCWVRGDLAREEDCQAAVARAREEFPALHVLVNNAGVYGPMGRLDEVEWQAWLDALGINLLGTVLMCRAVLPLFRARRSGKIINLSGGGATAPLPRLSAYAASKAAIVRLTETLALEVRDDGIDVNAIAPGALNTRLLDEVLAAGPDKVGQEFYQKALRQRDEGGTALDKGAELAAFLASSESDGITGRLISAVWDDWHHLPARKEQMAESDLYTLRRIVPRDRGLSW